MRETVRVRLRILFLIDHLSSTGGAERFAVGLATHLPRDRFELWICSTRRADPLVERRLAEAGVTHVNLGRRAKWDVHRLAGLVRLLRRQHFDVLHAHMFGSNLWGTMIGRMCGVPVIVAHQHSWSYNGFLRAWLEGKVIGRLATRFVAVSRADGGQMVAREGVPEEKVVMIPTAYIPGERTATGGIRQELGLAPDTPLIGIAAELRPEKRLDLLLEAHRRVLSAVPNAHLAIAGDGDCRPALERHAGELGLDGQIHFLGKRADVDSILQGADVAALSSDREGSPLLAFECMASCTPLVATAVGGVPDLVDDGRTGLLVPRRDPAALADALVRLLADPKLREAMGTAAREKLPQFTIEATAGHFTDLYETLVG